MAAYDTSRLYRFSAPFPVPQKTGAAVVEAPRPEDAAPEDAQSAGADIPANV
jgi:hypothetical protein